MHDLLAKENALKAQGHLHIAGVDEAGRGPLAGPVVAAACILQEGAFFEGIFDSKQLTAKQRARAFEKLTTSPHVIWAVGVVSCQVIDEINIYQATIRAMIEAVQKLSLLPDYLLVDGLQLPYPRITGEKVIRGDATCACIAAASILAKETRDQLMQDFDRQWPQYRFAKHKGYGTREHFQALAEHGPSPIHRRTFSPVRELCQIS